MGILLKRVAFVHEDIGDLSKLHETDYFIISMPKCGTTSLRLGFQALNKNIIQTHIDDTMFDSLSNGYILRRRNFRLKNLIDYRLRTKQGDIYIFSGYRDPISWYLSLANQFSLSLNGDLKNNLLRNLKEHFPWKQHSAKVEFELLETIVGVKLFDMPFDKVRGIRVQKVGRVTWVVYRLDKLNELENYIRTFINKDFTLINGRVDETDEYLHYKRNFKLSSDIINSIFADEYPKYFFADEQITELKVKYLNPSSEC